MSNEQKCQDNEAIGRWSKAEHQLFLEGNNLSNSGLEVYGKNWKEISKLVKTRNGAQIRSHAQKYFERKSKADSSSCCHEGNGEGSERLSATAEPCSYSQEETYSDFSYFMFGISKYLKENNKLCFWQELIEEGQKNSPRSKSHNEGSKTSFKKCQKPVLEREVIILHGPGQQI